MKNIVSKYINASLKTIKISDLFKEIFEIAERNNVQFPRELVTLVRSIVILEGVIAKIDPFRNYGMYLSLCKRKK